jgi:hypothetical protein
MNGLVDHGFAPTNAMVRNFAMQIAKNRLGKNWIYRFVDIYRTTFQPGLSSGLDPSREKADNTF